jgi:hypothetical protein
MSTLSQKVPKKRSKKKVTIKRRVSRRSIIRGPKTAWIYFCNERRPQILQSQPGLSFGDVCKQLAPQWAQLTDEEKQPFMQSHQNDKARFEQESQKLTDDQRKILKQHKKRKRAEKRDKPKSPLSPYMFFVIKERAAIVNQRPEATFMEVGKFLGDQWNAMDAATKEPYKKMSSDDKVRYLEQCVKHKELKQSKKKVKKE